MTWLKLVPSWIWWLLVLLTVTGGQQLRVINALSEAKSFALALADYKTEVAERDRRALVATREEERRRQVAVNEVENNAREKLELAKADAAAAEFAADGLRGEIKRLRNSRSATCGAIASSQRAAGESAVLVLGGLLEDADRMAGSLAEALERSRIVGLACEKSYDLISER